MCGRGSRRYDRVGSPRRSRARRATSGAGRMDETQHFDDEDWRLFQLLDAEFAAANGQNGRNGLREDGCDSSAQPDQAVANMEGMRQCLEQLRVMADGAGIAAPETAAESDSDEDVETDRKSSREVPVTSPQRFGRYEIVRQIGHGGMGIVFEARHPGLAKSVALKLIRSGQFASEEEISRFHIEARTAGRIRHPHIVSVHDVDQHQGEHFLTMDLVCGPTLAQVIRQEKPIAPRRAAEMIATVARAVQHLHEHKIIHRDLKPSNIMLDEAGAPYVTDFGLAKVFEGDSQQTTTGTIIGTASYMPPEQAAGRPRDVSVRSDVYSLGAILYEMLTGRPPFQEDNPLDTILQVLESPPEPLRRQNDAIPAELEAICLACLEKNPQDRLESAERLAEELERFLRGEPLQMKSRSWWERLRRWGRREPALSYRLGIVAAGALVVQGNYWLNDDVVPFPEHRRIMAVIAAWALSCVLCQRLMKRALWERRMPYLWAVTDVLFLTTLLVLAQRGQPVGPILIGYPFLVIASGLWFEVRLVWVMTALCSLGYLLLNRLRGDAGNSDIPPHYPYIYAVVLWGIGYIVAYQVERVRALNRYFERRCG
jgi:eukaryotic-like serine/threonine-protein kinase